MSVWNLGYYIMRGLHDLYRSLIVRIIKSRLFRWAVCSLDGEDKNCIQNSGEETGGKVATWKS
jgi:hypothetical protein